MNTIQQLQLVGCGCHGDLPSLPILLGKHATVVNSIENTEICDNSISNLFSSGVENCSQIGDPYNQISSRTTYI